MGVRELTPQGGAEEGEQRLPRVESPAGAVRDLAPPDGWTEGRQRIERVVGGV